MATNVFTGARAIFKVNDAQVAYASGVDGSEEILYEPADCLDQLETAEFAPVGYRCMLRCEVFRTVSGTVAKKGRGPTPPVEGKLGSLKGVGIFPRNTGSPNEILTSGSMSAAITDRLTQTTLYRYEQVKAASMNFRVTARGIVGQDVTFNAIRVSDEAGTA
jgi:hypothetical protein